jgi:hypothetical protein
MRKVLPLLALLILTGCGTPMRWEKPGIVGEAQAADQADCRSAARYEAMRMFPYGLGMTSYGPYSSATSRALWLQRTDSERFFAENRLAAFCMRNKGYELVPIEPAK